VFLPYSSASEGPVNAKLLYHIDFSANSMPDVRISY
jgi:hypothetical protein